jgi:hypothetical protein
MIFYQLMTSPVLSDTLSIASLQEFPFQSTIVASDPLDLTEWPPSTVDIGTSPSTPYEIAPDSLELTEFNDEATPKLTIVYLMPATEKC